MTIRLTMAAAALMLGACSSDEPSKAASSEEAVKGELAVAESLQPGQYAANVEVIRVDVPGMPAEQAEMMKGMMSSASAVERSYCLTPEEAQRNGREMFAEMAKGDGNCQFSDFDVDGGRVTGRLSCTGGRGGATSEVVLDGTMERTATNMHMTKTVNDSHMPGGRMEMEMRIAMRRTGDCTMPPANAAAQ